MAHPLHKQPLTPRFGKQMENIGGALTKEDRAPLGRGGNGEASLYILHTPSSMANKEPYRVVVKKPLHGHIDFVKHEARIAHRLRDGAVWATMVEPWEPLKDISGSQYNRISEEVHTMTTRGGYDNIHQLIAFLTAKDLPPLGGLISTPADGNLQVSAAPLFGFSLALALEPHLTYNVWVESGDEQALHTCRRVEGRRSPTVQRCRIHAQPVCDTQRLKAGERVLHTPHWRQPTPAHIRFRRKHDCRFKRLRQSRPAHILRTDSLYQGPRAAPDTYHGPPEWVLGAGPAPHGPVQRGYSALRHGAGGNAKPCCG